MIGHQAIGQDLHAPQGMGVPDHLEKRLVIGRLSEGGLPSHPAIHHVIHRPGIRNAKWARHKTSEAILPCHNFQQKS